MDASWIRCSTLVVLAASTGAQAAAGGIVVRGSTTLAPVIKELCGKFSRENRVSTNVQGGGSSEGIKCVQQGSCDVGLSSRAVSPTEATGLEVKSLGVDGMVFVVNQANPIRSLTAAQIAALFSGEIDNWEQPRFTERVVLVSRGQGSAEDQLFEEFFKLRPKGSPAGPADEVIVSVAREPGAISYMSYGIAQRAVGRGVKIIAFEGKVPSEKTIAAGKYPLRSDLVLLTRPPAPGSDLEHLVSFILAGRRDAFGAYGFVVR